MILTGRTVVLLVTMALATGGAAWGVHALITAAGGSGTDVGLDTDGNGKFDWLVVEAAISIPEAGTWDIYADLSSSSLPQGGSCGYGGVRPPVPILAESTIDPRAYSYPIAYTYERYFFPEGAQAVRMAFQGTDIARAGVDGPYTVHARLSLGGIIYGTMRPMPDPTEGLVEWNYTTKAYLATEFEQPVRSAYFTGGHADTAIDVDGDGLADFLELTAEVRVNIAGHYNLNGALTKGTGTDVVQFVGYAYRDLELSMSDTSVALRFRGDQIRRAGVDGPWDFSLILYGPIDIVYGNATPGPLPVDGILPPQPVYYPETLCGSTAAYRATDFDDTLELLRYTGRFEEVTPDWNGDGTWDFLVIRAEVEVFISAGFDLLGVLRPATGSTEIAHAYGQAWLPEGTQWAEFSFPGPEISASGVDGPYEATLSITPAAWGIDPTTTYTTRAYRAADFDSGYTNRTSGYWIGGLNATASGSAIGISVSVVRGDDMLTVVFEDTLTVTVADAAGNAVGAFKDRVYLPSGGSAQSFAFTLDGVSAGAYTITAVVGSPDRPVDARTIIVTV